jgi:triacylglycerol esterase/lipase EstA (alpha/beta hydrolase family)
MLKIRRFVLSSMLALSVLVALPGTAAAAPVRSNSQSEPVYFVHGVDALGAAGNNCGNTWNNAITKFRSLGWTGSMYTVGYYTADTNCLIKIANTDQNTSIRELGRLLAWDIYNRHSRYGRSVDIVAHSMGGLIARAAVTGSAKRLAGWPPYIYVEDGVTLSTPNNGTAVARLCWWTQCVEMRPGSSLLSWLTPNAQADGGTDWTYVGTEDDNAVPVASATTESYAGHYIWYYSGQPLEHSQLTNNVSGTYRFKWWNYTDPHWYSTTAGQPVIEVAKNACYFWRDR